MLWEYTAAAETWEWVTFGGSSALGEGQYFWQRKQGEGP